MTSHSQQETRSAPALVVERWNAWVRVWIPDTGELRWINLDEAPYELLEHAEEPLGGVGAGAVDGFRAPSRFRRGTPGHGGADAAE